MGLDVGGTEGVGEELVDGEWVNDGREMYEGGKWNFFPFWSMFSSIAFRRYFLCPDDISDLHS